MRTLAQQVESRRAAGFDPVGAFVPWLACIAVALAVHFAAPLVVNDYWVNVLRRVGVFVMAAVSLNIVNGFTGQFSMGHAGFMAVGAYVGAGTTYYGSLLFHGSVNDPAFATQGTVLMLAGTGLGACVAAAFGYVVGLPSLRLRGDYLAIVTLGFGEIIRVLLELTKPQLDSAAAVKEAGVRTLISLNGPTGFFGTPAYATLFWTWLFAAVTCVVAYRIKLSSSGRAFLSIREDEIAARSMGINLTRYKVRAFVLAAFFGGVAGALYAHTGVNPSPTDAGFARSFEIIILVVLGGLGSISGAVLAAILLTLLPEVLRDLTQYRLVIYALLLISMMLLRPQGLFGVREVWDFFKRAGAAPRPIASDHEQSPQEIGSHSSPLSVSAIEVADRSEDRTDIRAGVPASRLLALGVPGIVGAAAAAAMFLILVLMLRWPVMNWAFDGFRSRSFSPYFVLYGLPAALAAVGLVRFAKASPHALTWLIWHNLSVLVVHLYLFIDDLAGTRHLPGRSPGELLVRVVLTSAIPGFLTVWLSIHRYRIHGRQRAGENAQ